MLENLKFQFPTRVENSFNGYSKIVELFDYTKECEIDDVYLDFSNTTWFEANMAAGIGAVLTNLKDKLCDVHLINFQSPVEKILKKNQFLSAFGGEKLNDTYSTTIPYKKFDKNDIKAFQAYIDLKLLSNSALPEMTDALKKKINESILEIFINAATHSGCKHVFSCGQYFHNKQRLDFTIANLGTTIQKNVSRFLGQPKLSSIEAIEWAIVERNTTRQGDVPGGLGLSTLLSFLELNNGKVQIISSDAFWLKGPGTHTYSNQFDKKLRGTIVNIEFNINDKNSYMLSSERTYDNIF